MEKFLSPGNRLGRLPLGAALLLSVILSACASNQGTGGVGQPITAGDYVLTVTAMDNPAQSPDRFTNPKTGNRFVKFDFTMSNRGNLVLPVWASYFTLRSSGGSDNRVRTDVSGEQYLKQRVVQPGGSTQATIYFEMAANERPERLIFAPAIAGWRTEIAVNLS
ncbi:MAG: DUF4352 domain-containing protein [Chloroflexi bacterium]|nr:DUF4352 domain-containing protein [Chloroflexota bacterium]